MSESTVIVTTKATLQQMIDVSVKKAVAEVISDFDNCDKHDDLEIVAMSKVIASGEFGSRNTVRKLREEAIAYSENHNNYRIVIQRNGRWFFYINRFRDWFMKRNKKHEEELKIDPRRKELSKWHSR